MGVRESFMEGFKEEWKKETNPKVGAFVVLMGASTSFLAILRLMGLIEWSWGWVFFPLWGPVLFVILFLICTLLALIFFTWLSSKSSKSRRSRKGGE